MVLGNKKADTSYGKRSMLIGYLFCLLNRILNIILLGLP